MPEPIAPTRVIPAGEPLPVRTAPDSVPPPPPPRPPTVTEVAAPPPQPTGGDVVHRVHHHIVVRPPADRVPVRRDWSWLTSRIRP